MKKLILALLWLAPLACGQAGATRYEVEILRNPDRNGRDTREVNAVLGFDGDAVRVVSRRRPGALFKKLRYADIKYVEHSFSRRPLVSGRARAAALALLTGMPLFLAAKEKHWLTILTDRDFVVLKVENDNFRLLKMEFAVREIEVFDVSEDDR